MTFLIFVDWKKGPKWYLKVSPAIFFSLIMLNYLIIPVVNIAFFFYLAFAVPGFDVKKIYIESWVIFFLVVSASRIFEFFLVIKKSVLVDARNYISARKELDREENQLEEVLIEDETTSNSSNVPVTVEKEANNLQITKLREEKLPYLEKVRPYGAGEVRINKKLDMDEDIYSLAFVSLLSDE